jgi:hypothetical protein
MTNDLPRQIAGNFTGKGDPITMRFGPPLDLSRFDDRTPGPELYREIADAVREAIMALGREDRAWRQAHGLPDLHAPERVPAVPERSIENRPSL